MAAPATKGGRRGGGKGGRRKEGAEKERDIGLSAEGAVEAFSSELSSLSPADANPFVESKLH